MSGMRFVGNTTQALWKSSQRSWALNHLSGPHPSFLLLQSQAVFHPQCSPLTSQLAPHLLLFYFQTKSLSRAHPHISLGILEY